MNKTFAEFFAGAGMVSLALEDWDCVLANDIDTNKAASYRANHRHHDKFVQCDIARISRRSFSTAPDLVWGSFPCQDLSVAGNGAGLAGKRSGTYFEFWRVIDELLEAGTAPKIVAVENVVGSLTSNGGLDFQKMCEAFRDRGFLFGAMVIDAKDFLPQSRPRLFLVGVRADLGLDLGNFARRNKTTTSHKRLNDALRSLPEALSNWAIHWKLEPTVRAHTPVVELIDRHPKGVRWHENDETLKLLGMMSRPNLAKVEAARATGKRMIGFIYKRTRLDEAGNKVQRAEVRFDGIAGCLRTPGGGSSRQLIIEVDGARTSSRLLSVREAARLMGMPEWYQLPQNYNEGYHLVGDGVAVPVVSFLDRNLFSPLLSAQKHKIAAE